MQIDRVKRLPKIIFILGAGGSGSTLLGMLLGAHSEIMSVGEPAKFDKYVTLDLECTCGQRISKCPVWGQLKLWPNCGPPAPLRPKNNIYNILLCRSNSVRLDPLYLAVVERNFDFYLQVFNLFNKEVIVDSSQDINRFYYLYQSGQIRLIPLLIVRDGRAYIDSLHRRMTMSSVRATLQWIRLNLITEVILRRMNLGDGLIRVSYDRFVENPEEFLKKICKRLGLAYEESMLEYHKQTFHHIAGSPQRFSPKPIKPQEQWRHRISAYDRLVFSILGGNYFNRRFGVVS
jgi:hypothetical protein